jgi:hypothetical protein
MRPITNILDTIDEDILCSEKVDLYLYYRTKNPLDTPAELLDGFHRMHKYLVANLNPNPASADDKDDLMRKLCVGLTARQDDRNTITHVLLSWHRSPIFEAELSALEALLAAIAIGNAELFGQLLPKLPKFQGQGAFPSPLCMAVALGCREVLIMLRYPLVNLHLNGPPQPHNSLP